MKSTFARGTPVVGDAALEDPEISSKFPRDHRNLQRRGQNLPGQGDSVHAAGDSCDPVEILKKSQDPPKRHRQPLGYPWQKWISWKCMKFHEFSEFREIHGISGISTTPGGTLGLALEGTFQSQPKGTPRGGGNT